MDRALILLAEASGVVIALPYRIATKERRDRMAQAQLNDADDKRFGPLLSEMDDAKERHDMLAGEMIYLLTLLLLGSIQDAPADVRELFRGAAVQTLLMERDSGRVLRELCIDGHVAQ